ncbi:aryl-sulfate sulfotransferase [Anaerolentibacter hominis]|uniref:aryl-sulfate sulfotransferase n=1 Tax=Anaerolentibacter hominis TaxID=3079009 RepID=UPI0031B8A333
MHNSKNILNKPMKRLLLLCFLLLFMLAAAGCSKADAGQKDKKNNSKMVPEDTPDMDLDSGTVDPAVSVVKETTVPVEESIAVVHQKTDDQLQAMAESGDYTFEEPIVIQDPYQNSPLSAVVIFKTDKECRVRFTVPGDTPEDDVSGETVSGTVHRVPVIGLYPGRENKVLLELLDKDGKTSDKKEVLIQTDPLPKAFDNIVRVEKKTAVSAYPLTEVSGQNTPYPFAYDSSGNVRWYLSTKTGSYGMFPLSNGMFIFQVKDVMIETYEKPHSQELFEMDHLGRVHRVYYVEKGMHHDIAEMTPGGNFLICSSSIDGHVEDTIQEIDRETGAVVKTLDMREIFGDTYRDMIDWAHLNTVSYNPETDTVLLSPRNVHSGIKVNWTTNELEWILCNPKFWEGTEFESKVLKPEGDIIWHYQPHSIYEVPQDLDGDPDTIHIIMFDNHWHKTRKVKFMDDLEDSYVSIYTINEKEGTVRQEHTYAGVKSKITSNSILEYEDGRVFFMGGYLDPLIDKRKAMIYEFDYESEEAMNQYSFRYYFYRAYELTPNYEILSSPMDIGENYTRGTLLAPVKTKKKLKVPKETLTEEVTFTITDNVLFLNRTDHSVSALEFIGENGSYRYDLSFTGEGEDTYVDLYYNTAIPLDLLEDDTYKLVVNYKDTRYNTNQTITIAH